MALINKPYTFTNGAGNAADGTQVNADFDTLYSLVNGNIEAVNMKDGIITLAKLASETKVIENIYYAYSNSSITLGTSDTTILTQNITLSAQRYCFILAKTEYNLYSNTGQSQWLYPSPHILDGTTDLDPSVTTGTQLTGSYLLGMIIPQIKLYYGQLTSGAHTIYFNGSYITGLTGITAYYPKLFIVVFAF